MSNLPNFPILRPSLLLDFANSQQVDPRITFTRSSATTRTNANGQIETVAANVPRLDFDPVSGACLGLLIEEQRTNLLLNSLITGANLSTQTVTVTAVAHTISFYGSGSISLSGAHSATVNGSAAYPTRTFLTFTPSAGSLVVTVTGSVQFAQLEAGSFPTSYIPTGGSAATRAADAASLSGTNFSEWYRQDEGTFVATASRASTGRSFTVSDGTANENMRVNLSASSPLRPDWQVIDAGTTQVATSSTPNVPLNSNFTFAAAYKKDDFAISVNGTAVVTDTGGTVPLVDRMHLSAPESGVATGGSNFRRIAYYPKRLTDAELQALTA